MRIAALIQAHTRPDLADRLVDRLSTPLWSRYVHVDRKVDIAPFANLDGRADLVADRSKVRWGGFSQVAATLTLLRHAAADRSNTHFYLMSGQCFPVKSDDEIAALLSAPGCAGDFIQAEPMPRPTKPMSRLTRWHFHDLDSYRMRAAAARLSSLLPDRDVGRLLRGIPPSTGSSWWMLSQRSVDLMLRFLAENPWYVSAFRRTHCPDESFFQTLVLHLGITPERGSPTAARWVEGSRSPEPLTPEILAEVRQGWHLFARKVV